MEFEERIDELRELVRKRHNRWHNLLPSGMAWEDAELIIVAHLCKKKHLYNPKKSELKHWANRVISNQLKNLTRNNYLSYAKPCFNCPYNLSCASMDETYLPGECAKTISGIQDNTCSEYAKWEATKLQKFNVREAVSLDNVGKEIASMGSADFDMEGGVEFIRERMKDLLPEKHYKIFDDLYFGNKTEEEVALDAGYKTREVGRKAGYAQIASLKKRFREMVKEIIANEIDEQGI